MTEQQLKTFNKNVKNPENRKTTSSNPVSRKRSRKAESPTRCTLATEQSPDFGRSSNLICKNSACRAVLSIGDVFCRRCSCCICHEFADNKDPSLWLVCGSESASGDYCGSSCHIECALKLGKLGVLNLGQYMQLDGNYCCPYCGKVAVALGCWKRQLAVAKDARRVDVLCYRILLSHRLLEGTLRFKELHEIVTAAKKMLEAEVGPIDGESVKMVRGIVSRLAVAADAQKLCSIAIDKAEEWLANVPSSTPDNTAGALPAACRFLFEEVTSTSLAIVLIDIPVLVTDPIKGYKLWYCKSREETFSKEPLYVFPGEKKRIYITELEPCTDYTIRIISYAEGGGDLGHSEAKCCTKSVDRNPSLLGYKKVNSAVAGIPSSRMEQLNSFLAGPSSAFRVWDLSRTSRLDRDKQNGHLDGSCNVDEEQCYDVPKCESPKDHKLPPVSRELDLNVVSVPDLNEVLTPPLESSRDEDNGFTLERATGHDDDAASHGIEKDGLTKGSPIQISSGPTSLDEHLEYCVKAIRLLERGRYINQEFRLNFLTWYSFRSTEPQRRVVYTFIHNFSDDPKGLAAQLVHTFDDIVSSKMPGNNFTGVPS